MSGSLSDVRVPLTVPAVLAVRLRQLAERDCSTLAAVARRLIAHGLARELPIASECPPPSDGLREHVSLEVCHD